MPESAQFIRNRRDQLVECLKLPGLRGIVTRLFLFEREQAMFEQLYANTIWSLDQISQQQIPNNEELQLLELLSRILEHGEDLQITDELVYNLLRIVRLPDSEYKLFGAKCIVMIDKKY